MLRMRQCCGCCGCDDDDLMLRMRRCGCYRDASMWMLLGCYRDASMWMLLGCYGCVDDDLMPRMRRLWQITGYLSLQCIETSR